MIDLGNLKNTTRQKKKVQRVGRGVGSRRGKTSCRGGKGDSARQGWRKRFGYEGGQVPLYRKLPIRGFTRGKFIKHVLAINLDFIEQNFEAHEVVNLQTLREKNLSPRNMLGGLKILGNGELKKKVKIEAHNFSQTALEKLEKNQISFQRIEG